MKAGHASVAFDVGIANLRKSISAIGPANCLKESFKSLKNQVLFRISEIKIFFH